MVVKDKVKTIVYLEKRQYRWLKILSREMGKSMSQLIREFIDYALSRGDRGE